MGEASDRLELSVRSVVAESQGEVTNLREERVERLVRADQEARKP